MNITNRLFLYFLTVVIFTGVLASLVFSYGYDQKQERILRDDLMEKAKSIANTLAEHETFYLRLIGEEPQTSRGGGGKVMTKIISDIAMNDVWVYKADGDLGDIPEDMMDLLEDSLQGKELVERRDNDLFLAQPILKEGQVIGAVLLKADMAPFTQELKKTQRRFFLVLFVSVLVASILAAFLSKSFIQPIEKMAVYSRKLAMGKYEEKLALKEKDEFGELGKDLNFLSEKLQEAKESADAEKAREKLFLSKIGHELRTPLTLQRSILEAYREGRMKDITEPELLEKLYKDVRGIERLVEDLYLLAKLETPGFNMETEEIVLQDVLEDVLHALRDEEIRVELVEEPLLLLGDYGRLKQLLLNLLNNALEHGEDVSLTLEAPLKLRICNKTNLKEEELVHLFTPFYKGNSASKGTGLGLTIAKEITHAHGLELELSIENQEFVAELKA